MNLALGGRLAVLALRSALISVSVALSLLISASIAPAQDAPINPPPVFGQVPQGTGACSVEKSCADLAPLMIKSAEGPSPLEDNLRKLAGVTGGHVARAGERGGVAAWAVEALRRAGVDEAHTEKFTSTSSTELENVAGEIRGRDKPDEFVLVGARLASLDPADAAIAIDAARVIHASGNIPRRSIRFVLFTGDEQGEPGLVAYVRAHGSELVGMVAAVIYDSGMRQVAGYSLGRRKDLLAPVREALEPLKTIGTTEYTFDDSDDFDFIPEGVPLLVTIPKATNPSPKRPEASGTFDKAEIAELKRSTAIAAVTAYALADAPKRIGRQP